MSFREWVSYVESALASLVDVKGSFITPDNIYNRGSEENKKPFIYLGNDVVSGGKLYTGDAYDTHIELVGMKDELQDRRDSLGYDSSYDYRVDGIKHDLILVFKGFDNQNNVDDYNVILDKIQFISIYLNDNMTDLEVYFLIAKTTSYHSYIFLNSFSQILVKDWLKLMVDKLYDDVGLIGATGSWQRL